MWNRWLVLALVSGMLLAACGSAGPEATGNSEGIQVHGDWTITVYNEDGTLDQQVEFSNALLPEGEFDITKVLAGDFTAGPWAIWLFGDSGPAPCSSSCVIGEPNFPFATPFKNLTATAANAEPHMLSLNGTVIAEQDGVIDRVGSDMEACTPDTTPDDCTSDNLDGADLFTETSITPVNVTAGQSIAVSVDISFTSN